MWLVAVSLLALLYSGTAAAFECAGVTLPSTLVICSDPELMRLGDERQEAINEARGRNWRRGVARTLGKSKSLGSVLRHCLRCATGSPGFLPSIRFNQGVLQAGRHRAYRLPPGI